MCNNQLSLLKKEIEENINTYKSKRNYYRKRAFQAFISTTIMAAFTTFILGLNISEWEIYIRRTALGLTSLITIINAINSFYNHKDLWVANNKALMNLYELRLDILFVENSSNPPDEAKVENYKSQYQQIINEINSIWTKSKQPS